MMTRETFELLCRELQATGRVPQQHAFGRPPIPLHKQVLAFVWFIASAVIFPYRRYGRERPGMGKNLCETCKWNMQFHGKISYGKTGLPFQKFIFQWNESKNHVPFPTQLKFPESLKLVNGKRPQYRDVSTKVVSRKCKSVCNDADWRYG